MLNLYGIKNCDTVKKARRWLDDHGVKYQFHDFRQDGLDKKQLSSWVELLGREVIVNKRSTTWRNPTLIKRPVVQYNKVLLVGFKEAEFKNI